MIDLYFSEFGGVACGQHCPGVGTDTRNMQRWIPVTPKIRRELRDEYANCDRCGRVGIT